MFLLNQAIVSASSASRRNSDDLAIEDLPHEAVIALASSPLKPILSRNISEMQGGLHQLRSPEQTVKT
jgi:hypothetical protein